LSVVTAVLLAGGVDVSWASPPVAVKGEKVYIGDGRTIESGIVLIQDGRIRAVGADVRLPEGTTVIEADGGCVTPGLIDANARIESVDLIAPSRKSPIGDDSNQLGEIIKRLLDEGASDGERATNAQTSGVLGARYRSTPATQESLTGNDSVVEPETMVGEEEDLPPFVSGVRSAAVINEQSSEVVPHTQVLDTLHLGSRDFDRLVRGGVTTVYASPDASAVIGARGAIVHTAGAEAGRVLVPAAAAKATIGSEPSILGTYNRGPSRYSSSMYARRPNSRMGLVWVFRKAFYDAARRRDGLRVYGADTAEPEALAVLLDVLEGRVPLRIQARIQRDILAALRLADEFDLEFTLEEATEAYRSIDELKAASVPVVFGPIYERPSGIRVRSGEANRSRYYTFRALLEAGIPTALSAQEFREEDGLARQVMYAQRFGVSFDDAFRAVTQTPARILGLDRELGTLQRGKRADLVVWSGQPFAATSMPLVVLIDGEIVLDRR